MCGVMFSSKKDQLEVFSQEFTKLFHRGPDDSRIEKHASGLFGFHRLAIMDESHYGMQPFTKESVKVMCNGEIYNEDFLRSLVEYDYVSNSDCEVLLPLYKKYGVDMFELLDAEFACIIGDDEDVIAARDPLGIRPLFYGYDVSGHIMFASEIKVLHELCEVIEIFPPGHYFYRGEFVEYKVVTHSYIKHQDEFDTVTKKINELLTEGIKKRLNADAPMGFLLSGGLDSSLVCAIAAKELKKPIKTFSIGMDVDAIDLKYAKEVAEYIGSDHTEVIVTKKDVIKAIDEVIETLETYDITTIRASIPMYLLAKYIRNHTEIKTLLTGEISDELFGYKYTDFAPTPEDFQKESIKRIDEIHMYDVLRCDRTLARHSLEARVPFGDIAFVEYVLGIDPRIKMNTYGHGKYLLRKAFDDGVTLPHSILFRQKAAFSDAVGHSMVDEIKAFIDSELLDSEYESTLDSYTYVKPISKESMYYRNKFEQKYPKRENLLIDFWMPNKEWEGCQVGDPSARVLANYDQSGC